MPTTDKIEKQITLRASQSRVWRAIADASEFGRWFGFTLEGAFAPGKQMKATLVELKLEAVPEGTRLTIVESGFDRVPAQRRERAFRMNEGGWTGQGENLRKYVDGP